jgi:hypothetical protein
VTHVVTDAKALIVKVRAEIKTSPNQCLSKCEKTMSDLVECVEYLSNPGGNPNPKDELSKSMEELRAQVWKINDLNNRPAEGPGQKRLPTGNLTKARNRALKAIDKMEDLLNVQRRKC